MIEIRINKTLFKAAAKSAHHGDRTVDQQIELWTRLGMIAEQLLSQAEIEILLSGKVNALNILMRVDNKK